jgi:hypothetical protein
MLQLDGTQIQEILQGIPPADLPKYPKLFLSNMAQIQSTIPLQMTIDDMCNGLLKWREQTTTSPSGKHLGIYKALAKARKYNICTDKEISNNITYCNQSNLPISENASKYSTY